MAKPFILVMGASGTGKSTEAYTTFQDSYAIVNKANNHHFYKKTLKKRLAADPTCALKLPKRLNLIDIYTTGVSKEEYSDELNVKAIQYNTCADGTKERVRVKQALALETKIDLLLQQATELHEQGKPQKYANIIIDEMGTFIKRIFDEIAPMHKTGNGNVDPRKAYPALAAWARNFTDLLRQFTPLGIGVCVVFHVKEPTEEKMGGADAPSGIGEQMCQDSDGAIQRYMKDADMPGQPATRHWNATASAKWNRKLVGLESEDEGKVADLSLREILVDLAGYDL